MGITGSQPALMQNRAGVARAGATRAGYYKPYLSVNIGGVDRTSSILRNEDGGPALTVSLAINDERDECTFSMKPGSTVPSMFDTVVVGMGLPTNATFAGQVNRVSHHRIPGMDATTIEVECVDWLRRFDGVLVTQTWANTSASTIAQDIFDGWVAPTFFGSTARGIQAGLPTLERFVAKFEQPSSVLRRLVTEMGGGGFVVRADKDLRFFDLSGDVLADAGTNPETITNTLSTVKAFSHTYDGSQTRATTTVTANGTTLLIPLPFAADQATLETALFAYGFPVLDATEFNPLGGTLLVGDTLLLQFSSVHTPASAALGTLTTALASPGATTIALDAEAGFTASGARWFTSDSQSFFYGECVAAGATQIENIPASGYGSLLTKIPSGAAVYMVHSLGEIVLSAGFPHPAALLDVPAGTPVRTYVSVTSPTNAGEHHIDAPALDYTAATNAASKDLLAFAAATGIPEVEWTTTDMNALPGTQQAIAYTGADPISATLTITNVDLHWPVVDEVPWRTCRASDVKPPQLAEILAEGKKG